MLQKKEYNFFFFVQTKGKETATESTLSQGPTASVSTEDVVPPTTPIRKKVHTLIV